MTNFFEGRSMHRAIAFYAMTSTMLFLSSCGADNTLDKKGALDSKSAFSSVLPVQDGGSDNNTELVVQPLPPVVPVDPSNPNPPAHCDLPPLLLPIGPIAPPSPAAFDIIQLKVRTNPRKPQYERFSDA